MKPEPSDYSNRSNHSDEILKPRPNPNARWQCGLKEQGIECLSGPTAEGICCQLQRQSTCENGSRQECESNCPAASMCELTRLRHSTSPDEIDLAPCVPTRVAWFARETLALNLGVLIGGALLVCMAIPQRETVFVPGQLSHSHSQILGNVVVSERCSQCHPNSHAEDGIRATQSDLCLKCHGEHLPNAKAKLPHDLNSMQFASLRGKEMMHDSDSLATECATCHIEHGGVHKDIKQITDARCQACHQSTFASFSSGHPEFKNYPRQLDRVIAFDHSQHRLSHFAKKGEEFKCATCHVESTVGQESVVTSVISFDQACARCHSEPLKASSAEGWAFLEIPSIDSSDSQSFLRNWPLSAQFGREGRVGMAVRLLLAADPAVSNSIAILPADGDLAKLFASNDSGQESFFVIARGIQTLLNGLANRGQAEIRDRLTTHAAKVLQRDLSADEQLVVQRVAIGMPPDLFSTANQTWFGTTRDLAADVQPLRAQTVSSSEDLLLDDEPTSENDLLTEDDSLLGSTSSAAESTSDDSLLLGGGTTEPLEAEASAPKLTPLGDRVGNGGWYLDHQTMSIRYLPVGHADPTLAAWIEYCAMVNQPLAFPKKGSGSSLENDPAGATLGACIECHQPQIGRETSFVRWESRGTVEQLGGFTKFSHRPHLTLTLTRDCAFCHRETNKEELSQIRLHSSAKSIGDFQSIEHQQCNSCHRPNGANEGCTQCHNYHVHQSSLD